MVSGQDATIVTDPVGETVLVARPPASQKEALIADVITMPAEIWTEWNVEKGQTERRYVARLTGLDGDGDVFIAVIATIGREHWQVRGARFGEQAVADARMGVLHYRRD